MWAVRPLHGCTAACLVRVCRVSEAAWAREAASNIWPEVFNLTGTAAAGHGGTTVARRRP